MSSFAPDSEIPSGLDGASLRRSDYHCFRRNADAQIYCTVLTAQGHVCYRLDVDVCAINDGVAMIRFTER